MNDEPRWIAFGHLRIVGYRPSWKISYTRTSGRRKESLNVDGLPPEKHEVKAGPGRQDREGFPFFVESPSPSRVSGGTLIAITDLLAMENATNRLWTKSRIIRERRWTESLIRKFLGNPDETRPNPNYRSAAPMKLYQLGRVLEAESTNEFHEALERADRRRRSALAVAQTKREELIEWVHSLPSPRLPAVNKRDLTALAVAHYNELWNWRRGDLDKLASVADDRDFLDRISVNYVRHDLTDYEGRILEMHRKIGKNEAIQAIRTKILQAIASRFVWLADECARQQDLLSVEPMRSHGGCG